MPKTVLLVDDDPFVVEACKSMIATSPDFTVAGVASNGREGVRAFERLQPDVTLMDLQMPEMGGVDAIQAICSRQPRAVIVALTTFGSRSHMIAALRAGASGYLMKDVKPAELVAALRHAIAGEMPLSSSIRQLLVGAVMQEECENDGPADVGLTPRELEALGHLAEGYGNAEIAARMYVSEGSVKQYMTHLADKLGVRSRTQILVRAIRLRLVDPLTGKTADPGSQS